VRFSSSPSLPAPRSDRESAELSRLTAPPANPPRSSGNIEAMVCALRIILGEPRPGLPVSAACCARGSESAPYVYSTLQSR
jgi:hypothetical protein